MQSASIVILCVLSAIAYGILHDQVTARVCVEYFTIGHPQIFGTNDPTLLGIGWGIVATWWAGLALGIGLAIAARYGSGPKRDVASLVRPVGILLGIMAVSALIAGVTGALLGSWNLVSLVGPIARDVPDEKHVRFLADLWAHTASYAVGIGGGLVVISRVWNSRTAT